MLSERERSAILDAEIERYVAAGYRLQARAPTTAQLVKPKAFSVVAAAFWLLFLLVGLLIYLLVYLARRDEAAYLSVDEQGVIHARGDAISEPPSARTRSGAWICQRCQHENGRGLFDCMRCGAGRPHG